MHVADALLLIERLCAGRICSDALAVELDYARGLSRRNTRPLDPLITLRDKLMEGEIAGLLFAPLGRLGRQE